MSDNRDPEYVEKFREKYPEIDVFEISNPEFLHAIAKDMDEDTARANEDARLLAELGETALAVYRSSLNMPFLFDDDIDAHKALQITAREAAQDLALHREASR